MGSRDESPQDGREYRRGRLLLMFHLDAIAPAFFVRPWRTQDDKTREVLDDSEQQVSRLKHRVPSIEHDLLSKMSGKMAPHPQRHGADAEGD
jgi:hypothetical protein